MVVTGGPDERELSATVAGGSGVDLGGGPAWPGWPRCIAGADGVVVGNTGPGAPGRGACGTPVVSLFAPTVPFGQWGPYRVPAVRLGDAGGALPGHPGHHAARSPATPACPGSTRAGVVAGGSADRPLAGGAAR